MEKHIGCILSLERFVVKHMLNLTSASNAFIKGNVMYESLNYLCKVKLLPKHVIYMFVANKEADGVPSLL